MKKKNLITFSLIFLTNLKSFSISAKTFDSDQLFGVVSAGFYDSDDLDSEDISVFNSLEAGIKLSEQLSSQGAFIFNKENVDIALSSSYYHNLNDEYALLFDVGVITNKADDKISPLFGIGFSTSIAQNTKFIFKTTSFGQNNVYASIGLRFHFTEKESRYTSSEEIHRTENQNNRSSTLGVTKSCRNFYVVQEGEHLWSIARKIGMNPWLLTSYNIKRFINLDVIHAGEILCLNRMTS